MKKLTTGNPPALPASISELKPAPYNPREITANAKDGLRASLERFGDLSGIVVNLKTGHIIAGHQRRDALATLAADAIKWDNNASGDERWGTVRAVSGESFRVRAVRWSKSKEKAANIAANSPTITGEFTDALQDVLSDVLAEMPEAFDVLAFADLLVDDSAPEIPPQDPAPAPAVAAKVITRHGDVWTLGEHRLRCGDSMNPEDVAALMDGTLAVLLFTSPPYGQQRDYGIAKKLVIDWTGLMTGVFSTALLAPDAQILVNLGMVHKGGEWIPYWDEWIDWMRDVGWKRFGFYVWDQGSGMPGNWNGRLAPSHEFVFHFNNVAKQANKIIECKCAGDYRHGGGMRGADGTIGEYTANDKPVQEFKIPDSVIRVTRQRGGLGDAGEHPAVFSVALAEFVIKTFSAPGAIAYEPFCGSGSQILAAERTGRKCFAMEIEPAYCDAAIRRWQNETGKQAVRQDGRTFQDISGCDAEE